MLYHCELRTVPMVEHFKIKFSHENNKLFTICFYNNF